MILNLLRVEQLRVEDMMKRSFCEASQQRQVSFYHHMIEVKTRLNISCFPFSLQLLLVAFCYLNFLSAMLNNIFKISLKNQVGTQFTINGYINLIFINHYLAHSDLGLSELA